MSNTNMFGNWYETEVGKQITSKKYFHDGENFDDFVNRVSGIFSEELQPKVKKAILDADFLPAGRSLYGAGSKGKFKATMSNCYIMPSPEDNIESIYEVNKEMARIFSMGGGAGVNISNLRPNGAKVNNSAKTSTGAVSFIKIFNETGEVIGSNNRRAALMIGLNCSHPDIEDFLKVKQNDTAIQSANLSILFTDEFMKAVENDSYYECSFTIPETGEKISKAIRARDFFMDFCKSQWDYAEPGALYIDKIRNYNLLSGYPESIYHIDICNPCAEFCGNSYNACNLGSINLYNIVDNPFTNKSCINYEKLEKLVELGVIALDEILDYGYDMQPLDANRKCISDWRAIGLGVFGLADMFIALGVRYGSDKSIKVVKDIMTTIFNTAVETSAKLARDKGTFGKYEWKYIKESPLIKALPTVIYRFVEQYGLRNGSLISVAPTGSIATMTGLSGGVEPLYQISYERTTHALEKTGKTFTVVAKSVEHLMNKLDISLDRAKEFDSVIASHDINPLDRIKLQSMMQIYDDNAISSTINLKHEATVEDIFNAYIEAWRSGCKGITVFRDGCARTSILGKQKEDKKEEKDIVFDNLTPVKIGETDFRKYIKHTACVDKLYVFAGHDEQNNIVEVFTNIVQGCTSNIGTITRLTSALLRSGVKIDYIIKQLRKTKCQGCIKAREKGNDVSLSCGNAIADAIEEEYKRLKQEVVAIDESGLLECPECHKKTLRPEGKCFTCQHCGWSKCE